MHVAFIVTVNLDDTSDLPGVAAEIGDDLTNFEVIEVHPWARPTLQPVPITTQQPNTTIQ
jgi:hypothetical protein